MSVAAGNSTRPCWPIVHMRTATGDGAATSAWSGQAHAATAAERWGPRPPAPGRAYRVRLASGNITQRPRYCPMAEVLTSGGGVCGDCMRDGYLEKEPRILLTTVSLQKRRWRPAGGATGYAATAPATVRSYEFCDCLGLNASVRKVALIGLADVTWCRPRATLCAASTPQPLVRR